jgi:hypothetical protein
MKPHESTVGSTAAAVGPGMVRGWVDNPMMKLYQQLNSGELGDQSLPFHLLIAAYRRRKLMAGSTGVPGSDEQMYGALDSHAMVHIRRV